VSTFTFDPFCRDESTRALRGALEAGHREALLKTWGDCGAVQREFLVHALTAHLAPLETIHTWPDDLSASPLPWLLRASQGVEAGGRHLEQAEEDLGRAIELEDDGVAFSISLRSGAKLGIDAEDFQARYDRAVQASPRLPFAADHMLVGLMGLGDAAGGPAAMFAFARLLVSEAGGGDPRHRLIAMAHTEQSLLLRADRDSFQRHRENPDVQGELLQAAQRSVFDPSFGRSPQHWLTLNWFAYIFCTFGRLDVARPLLEAIGPNPSWVPWMTHLSDPPGALLDVRTRAGLPPLEGDGP
jgi:hypothetical protein